MEGDQRPLGALGAGRGLEKGQRIRVDATAVQTNVHYPLDSELLYDGIRVVTRWLGRLRDWEGMIRNRRGKKRLESYRDLSRWRPRRPTMPSRRWPRRRSGAIPSVWPGRATGPLSGAVAPSHRADSTTGAFGRGRRGPGEDLFPLRRAHRYYQEEPSGNGFRPQSVCQHGGLVADPGLCGGTGNPADSNYVQP